MAELIVQRSIGFRTETKCVHWAVVDGPREQPRIECVETLAAPKSYGEAEALAWYAREVGAICARYAPSRAWVREAEAKAKTKRALVAQRCRIEGVIIAAASERGLAVVLGPLATITASMKPSPTAEGKKKSAKSYLDADEFRGLDWAEHGDNDREAILVAVAALP